MGEELISLRLKCLELYEVNLHRSITSYTAKVIQEGKILLEQKCKDDKKLKLFDAEIEDTIRVVKDKVKEFSELMKPHTKQALLPARDYGGLDSQIQVISTSQTKLELKVKELTSRLNTLEKNNSDKIITNGLSKMDTKVCDLEKQVKNVELDLSELKLNLYAGNVFQNFQDCAPVEIQDTNSWSSRRDSQADDMVSNTDLDQKYLEELIQPDSHIDFLSLDFNSEEVEVCTDNDLGAKKKFDQCLKNPGHANFIPIKQLTLKHLPKNQKRSMVQFIKAVSDITVRVAVGLHDRKLVFGDKAEFLPLTRGDNTVRYGTGFIKSVKECKGSCPCNSCKTSSYPYKNWVEVIVKTGKMLVMDQADALDTVCWWGYDEEKSPVVSLEGMGISITKAKKKKEKLAKDHGLGADLYSDVVCLTHDLEFGLKLKEAEKHVQAMRKKNFFRFKQLSTQDKIVFIVSHPHGYCKHVSVGEWVEKQDSVDEGVRFIYTADTCPGSLGALVCIPDMTDGISSPYLYYHHQGCNEIGGFNIAVHRKVKKLS
ncbi:uncharacterized protein LOC131954795 [Physella acuta]|uniref:uncharacterized protein LOC131954795 n=1 Tax=Physella acuta TaxID=109671 RepID=UPI0027DB55EE|nr:uncharacterized protein LOC131954795 [Physella acuta]XP_059174564.1 uncharacterized protein LOC131954795 [Physella acuta]XP_059174565.1 uncharacterized protein LOC131954795 [Physella acuta]